MSSAATATAPGVKKQTRAKADRDEIIVNHLPLVKAIANRVRESLPVQVELDDLVHAGVLGLVDAIEKYAPEKNVAFHLYAKHRIRGAILDSLRQLDWASRDLRKRFKSIENLGQKLGQDLGRPPTEIEIAQEMKISVEQYRKLTRELYNAGLTAGQPHRVERPDHSSFADATESNEQMPDELFAHRELRRVLDDVIGTLPVRYQTVIKLYYDQDRTMKQIGAELGVNESRVSQIHKTALEKLEAALRSSGFQSPQVFLQDA